MSVPIPSVPHSPAEELAPFLRRMDSFDAFVSVSMRTAFSDMTADSSHFQEIARISREKYGAMTLSDLTAAVVDMMEDCDEGVDRRGRRA